MTILDRTSPFAAAPARRWVARATIAVATFYRSWRNRREFLRLGDMTDSELADIGLVRTDLDAAAGLPFGRDPTIRLNSVARERILSREEAARRIC